MLPYTYLKYFPPQFILRNPLLEGVYRAVSEGKKVAGIVIQFTNMKELMNQLEASQEKEFCLNFKKEAKFILETSDFQNDILVVHDYNNKGLTVFLKIDENRQSVPHIEQFIAYFIKKLQSFLSAEYPYLHFTSESGYMFVERENSSTHQAILKAQQQAAEMAEKRIHSKYIDTLLNMREIIQKQDIRLLAQPIIQLETNEVKAWEILTRGPEGTPLENPLQLFSVARQTNMVYDLEMLILEKAMLLVKESKTKEDIYINFTPLTLGNKRFVSSVKKAFERHPGVSPQNIILEITERDSIEGMAFFKSNIMALRDLGIRIAVDDTGAGYASLHTISEVLPDIIKIDRSVIENIDTNRVKESMLKGLLLIARETGSLVVAEGIEKKEEADVLTRNRVDLAQGYFYAKPGLLQKERVAF
ncbi:EAL domain-containing protein [Bacillus sp. FJAT-42376]|uniref:EAL domain-containing protein n=1 Tax=Bacillus sp. FJAT-42376 TaxID=2014076 RepID=UPI001F151BBB|nr:EAL domain-containing protein [Bacillus sp. FJAT-42376]